MFNIQNFQIGYSFFWFWLILDAAYIQHVIPSYPKLAELYVPIVDFYVQSSAVKCQCPNCDPVFLCRFHFLTLKNQGPIA